MERKISREDFSNALKCVVPGVEKKTTMGMDFVVLEPNSIKSFNDNICIVAPIETGVNGAVHGEELFKILDKIVSDTVLIEDDKTLVRIKGGKVKSKLLKNDTVFESLKGRISSLGIDGLEWKKLPDFFIKGLELCLFTISGSCSLIPQASLKGVAIKDNVMMTCDNFRAAKYRLDISVFEGMEDMIVVPTLGVTDLVRMDKTFLYIAKKGNWLYLKAENDLVVALKLSVSEFPYEKVVSLFEEMKFEDGIVYEFPKGLEYIMSVAEICADTNKLVSTVKEIYLENIGGELVATGTKDLGETSASVNWEKEAMPEGVRMTVSPEFMVKILPSTRKFQLSHTEDVATVLFETDRLQFFLIAEVKN